MIKLMDVRDRVPVNRLHQDRVATISKEDVAALVKNLAEFDDMHFAQTSTGGRFRPGSPESLVELLPNSFRVRRLREVGAQNPSALAEAMHGVLQAALREWPVAFKDELALWERSTGGLLKPKPTPHDKVQMRATVATYLLAELGRPEALPWLYDAYLQQKKWIDAIPEDQYRYTPQAPVPPPILLYAMHRLITAYPLDRLSAQGQQARTDYLSWSQAQIPDPRIVQGVRSDSTFDESDPMYKLIDPEGTMLAHAKKVELAVYPTNFKDEAPMQKFVTAPYVTQRSEEWFGRLEATVSALNQARP